VAGTKEVLVFALDVASLIASAGNWSLSSRNLNELRSQPPTSHEALPLLSVCLPVRDEEHNLDACLEHILGSVYPQLEVLVYDDESRDGTAAKLQQWEQRDPRVRRVPTRPLPPGWTGSQAARGAWLLFTDADVRFSPWCLETAVAYAIARDLGLLSGIPRQLLGSLGEGLLVPMINFMLWSYLPLHLVRQRPDLPIAAGCGQFLLVKRQAYAAAGGHAAFPDDTHDGLYLPRRVRASGWKIDLLDLAPIASCRMYSGGLEAWRGFSRNAFEAFGSVWILLAFSLWHLAHLSAWLLLPSGSLLAVLAVGLQLHQRWRWAARLHEPLWTVPLHPLSLAAMLIVQWWSLFLTLRGRRSWKGRTISRSPRRDHEAVQKELG
jgi:glycosyltransferase involved in cell wall biosynthesis